jgi:hypothetical protein
MFENTPSLVTSSSMLTFWQLRHFDFTPLFIFRQMFLFNPRLCQIKLLKINFGVLLIHLKCHFMHVIYKFLPRKCHLKKLVDSFFPAMCCVGLVLVVFVLLCVVLSSLIWSCLVMSWHVRSCLVLSFFCLFCLVLSCLYFIR